MSIGGPHEVLPPHGFGGNPLPRDEKQRAAYEFFLAMLEANEAFTVQDLIVATAGPSGA